MSFSGLTLYFSASQAQGLKLIRDAEIESTIRSYCKPIFEAGGLVADDVSVHIIHDASLNAFVAGGQQMFIHTGLIMASKNPNQLIGVIAHETGHIIGGHLARRQEALANASIAQIIATVLGAAAVVAGGSGGDAGVGVILGGQQIAARTFLAYNRIEEASADAAALRLLDQTKQSSRGFMEFFEILKAQEVAIAARNDPYVRSHPLTGERVTVVAEHVANSPYRDAKWPALWDENHQRMKAKIVGYLMPDLIDNMYPETDQSIPAIHARAVRYSETGQTKKALELGEKLLAQKPQDPFFNEFKAEILFKSARVEESIPYYREAVKYYPNSGLLRAQLGTALVASEEEKYLDEAERHLKEAVRIDRRLPVAWHHLALVYGRKENFGLASWASAERYFLTGDLKAALQQAERAIAKLPDATPGRLRSEDLKAEILNIMSKQGNFFGR